MAELKDIKRELAAAFNAVKKSLKADSPPDEAQTAELIRAARAMADFLSVAGEESARFTALAEEVAGAAAAGDLAAAAKAHGAMKTLRGECHDKYKK